MELVDKYLQSVKMYLPRGEKDDIINELSENIRSQMEDREAELGRPLTQAEQEAILKKHGSPMEVAGRYHTEQRSVAFGKQLIGPVLFPIYIRVLGISLAVGFLIRLALIFVLQALDETVTFWGTLPGIVTHLLVQSAIVTLIFALVEKNEGKLLEGRSLEKKPATGDTQWASRLGSFAELAILAVVLLWLVNVWVAPDVMFDPLPDAIQLAPIWQQIYLPLIVLTLAEMAQVCISLFRPAWARFRLAARVVSGGIWLIFMFFLLTAGEWVVLTGDTAGNHRQEIEIVNEWFFYSLVITALVSIGITMNDVYKLIRVSQKRGELPA